VSDLNGADAALADRIASRGREELVERLRKAYADAAAAHADIVSLDEQRIEALVQAAADRADGLQWRRALANVAAQELGVSLAQALTHPAVRKAQEQLGAPSYEASLAELVAIPVPPVTPGPVTPGQVTPEPEPTPVEQELGPVPVQPEWVVDEPEMHGATGELEAIEADDEVFELMPSPAPLEYEAGSYEAIPDEVEEPAPPILEPVPYEPEGEEPAASEEPAAADPPAYGSEHTDYPPPHDDSLQVLAYHLGGVANLPTGRNGLDLRLAESGLDILQPEGEIIGRLHWSEIDTLEVVAVRGRLRRQARTLSRIVVRTKHGDASFEIPGLSSDELEARVKPLVSRYGSA
jgi:hypothetical protein